MVCKSVSEAVSRRILQLCRDKNITVNKLATLSAVTQSTVNDIINMKSKNIGIVTSAELIKLNRCKSTIYRCSSKVIQT